MSLWSIFKQLFNNGFVSKSRDIANITIVQCHFSQDTSHDLSGSGLWQTRSVLNNIWLSKWTLKQILIISTINTKSSCFLTDSLANQNLKLVSEFLVENFVLVGCNEAIKAFAFNGMWTTYNCCFRDKRMLSQNRLDLSGGHQMS